MILFFHFRLNINAFIRFKQNIIRFMFVLRVFILLIFQILIIVKKF